MSRGRRFQFVWHLNPLGWRLWWGPWTGSMAYIYRWWLDLGPLQIRRWETRPFAEVKPERLRRGR